MIYAVCNDRVNSVVARDRLFLKYNTHFAADRNTVNYKV